MNKKEKITSGLQFAILGSIMVYTAYLLLGTMIVPNLYKVAVHKELFKLYSIFLYNITFISSSYSKIYLSLFIISSVILVLLVFKRTKIVEFLKDSKAEIFSTDQAIIIASSAISITSLLAFTSLFMLLNHTFDTNIMSKMFFPIVIVDLVSIVLFLIARNRCIRNNNKDQNFKANIMILISIIAYPAIFSMLLSAMSYINIMRLTISPITSATLMTIIIISVMFLIALFCFIIGANIKNSTGQKTALQASIIMLTLYVFTIGLTVFYNGRVAEAKKNYNTSAIIGFKNGNSTPGKIIMLEGAESIITYIPKKNHDTIFTDENIKKAEDFLKANPKATIPVLEANYFLTLNSARTWDLEKAYEHLKNQTENFSGGSFNMIVSYVSLRKKLLEAPYNDSLKQHAEFITNPDRFISSSPKCDAELRIISEKYGLKDRASYYTKKSDNTIEYKKYLAENPEVLTAKGVVKGKITINGKPAAGIKVSITPNKKILSQFTKREIETIDPLQIASIKKRHNDSNKEELTGRKSIIENIYKNEKLRRFYNNNAEVYSYNSIAFFQINHMFAVTTTDKDGKFEFRGLKKSGYSLAIMLDGENSKLTTKTDIGVISINGDVKTVKTIELE